MVHIPNQMHSSILNFIHKNYHIFSYSVRKWTLKITDFLNIVCIEKQNMVSECPKCAEFKTMDVL